MRLPFPVRVLPLAVAGLLSAPNSPAAAEFRPAERLTDSLAKYQLSRTSNAQMGVDSAGTLHVVYWSGGFGTSTATPSRVFHRSWTLSGGWSAPVVVDDSEIGGMHVGGRHPTLAVAPDDSVWVAWHDHRHCTASPGNWIDNIEIYADRMPFGGSFSATDLRLTTSSAPHLGDSGYLARVAIDPTGRASVAWYDFSADPDVADVYLKTSDAAGNFDLGETMNAMRATDETARGGTPAYSAVDLAVDSAGVRHLAWGSGFSTNGDLYYAESAVGGGALSEATLATGSANHFDPPHVAVAPNDDVWIAWADTSIAGSERVRLLRRPAGQPAFLPPMSPVPTSGRQRYPDHEIDAAGIVHLVWVDDRAGTHVYYGAYDPVADALVDERRLTETSASWARPTLCLDGDDVHVLFEQSGAFSGDVWFATTAAPNAASAWTEYR